MKILDSVEGLKQNVEFLRSKHKAKEVLTFQEICESINTLYEAYTMSSEAYVKEVFQKKHSLFTKSINKSDDPAT